MDKPYPGVEAVLDLWIRRGAIDHTHKDALLSEITDDIGNLNGKIVGLEAENAKLRHDVDTLKKMNVEEMMRHDSRVAQLVLQVERFQKLFQAADFFARKAKTSGEKGTGLLVLLDALEGLGDYDEVSADECRAWCDNPEHQKRHDFSKWPDPYKCELCRLRIKGHQHVKAT
jgi:hypothetical protein